MTIQIRKIQIQTIQIRQFKYDNSNTTIQIPTTQISTIQVPTTQIRTIQVLTTRILNLNKYLFIINISFIRITKKFSIKTLISQI